VVGGVGEEDAAGDERQEYCGFTMLLLIRRYCCVMVLISQAAVIQVSTELCGRECNWTVPPTPLSGRVGNALMQLNDSSIVRDVRECQILIHDCLAHRGLMHFSISGVGKVTT